MKSDLKRYRVKKGARVDLKDWPTRIDPLYESKSDYKKMLADHVDRLSKLQQRLYAANTHALLIIFQAMDTAGKDGAIKHVMSGVNPQGCQVFSFSHPSAEELKHDFLWRTTRSLPERGRIGIFNRSYYEEVLIVRVHPEILEAEGLPPEAENDHSIWEKRYQSIAALERHLHDNGTRVIKIFLHISKDEQKKRLLERIDVPEKNWKMSAGDLVERKYWKEYRKAYEDCIAATSTSEAPWFVVPADDKETARLIVSKIVLETIEAMNLSFPETTPERAKELAGLRAQLEAE